MKTIIMDDVRIERTLKRIAFQILENCYQEEEVTVIGIEPRGVWVAAQLIKNLGKISKMKVKKAAIDVDNLDELGKLSASIKGRSVVLVDDVVKSGDTMMRAASAISAQGPKVLITACLVDRKHRRFPIKSDLTGLSLATTLQEHIQLVIEPKPTIYLE
ncbi:MAG: phosphoribosyltransferase [Flavobacteriales bacterium]|nr:phosphoribosyltransferase [Flavobacteriales bacterium]